MKTLILLFLILPFTSFSQFIYQQGFSIGSTAFDAFGAVEVTTNGSKICAGSFENNIDVDPGAGSTTLTSNGADDGMVIAYDPSGVVAWAKNFGDTGLDVISNLEIDNAGNIYITGYFEGTIDLGGGALTSIGSYDIFIAKLDASGNHLWSKRLGGIDESTTMHIAIDPTGNDIALCGYFSDSMDLGTGMLFCLGSTNPWVAKLDGSGNTQWSYAFGGSGFATDRASSVSMDQSGNVYVTGNFNSSVDFNPGAGTHVLSSVGSADYFLVKYDQAGNFINAFSIGGLTGDVPFEVTVTDIGEIFITGYSNSDTIDVDPDSLNTVNLFNDTNINFVQDLILVKYDSTFDYQWGFRFGNKGNDIGHMVRIDNQGNVILAGVFNDAQVDFDPGAGIFTMNVDSTMFGTTIPFLAHYDNNGNFLNGFAFEDSMSLGELYLENGRVWVAGVFRGVSVDLDPGTGTSLMTNSGDRDAFLAAYSYLPVNMEELIREEFNVYPNPCTDKVRININHDLTEKISILDFMGKVIRTNISTKDGYIDMNGLPSGNYFISVGEKYTPVTVIE